MQKGMYLGYLRYLTLSMPWQIQETTFWKIFFVFFLKNRIWHPAICLLSCRWNFYPACNVLKILSAYFLPAVVNSFNCNNYIRHKDRYVMLQMEKTTLNHMPTPMIQNSRCIFSRRQTDDIFLIFPRKQDSTFHANCLLRRQFAWNVISCFLRKIRKIFQNVVCWKFYPEC